MAHQLDVKDDGTVAMFYVKANERDVPWHRLGTAVPDALTAHDAMKTAGLDWNVTKRPLYASLHGVIADGEAVLEPVLVPDQFAIIRDEDNAVLGTVGGQYEPFQNSEAFEFLDSLVDSGEAKYDTAGSLRGGRSVFISMKTPRTILIGGADPVDTYIMLSNAHDGSRAVTGVNTVVRTVCANTEQLALRDYKAMFTMRHDQTMRGKVQEARDALGMTFAYFDEWEKAMNDLVAQDFTLREFETLVGTLYPARGSDEKANRERQLSLIGTLESSPTIGDGIRRTKWGAFNAVTEYLDHYAAVRATSIQSVEERRFTESMFGANRGVREKAYALLAGSDR